LGRQHRDRHAAQAACPSEEPKPKYPDGRLHLVKVDQVVATFKYAAEKVGRTETAFDNVGHS